jgi:hypothetical protein
MPVSKKKVIKNLEGLDDSLRDLMKKQYPAGYESSVTRIINAKKEHIFVFPLETEDATYLIKVPSTKNSDGEYNVDFGKKGEFDSADDDDFRNDADEVDSSDEEFGDDDGTGSTKDPSYEPDFDN